MEFDSAKVDEAAVRSRIYYRYEDKGLGSGNDVSPLSYKTYLILA
jgi:hypothetical protein